MAENNAEAALELSLLSIVVDPSAISRGKRKDSFSWWKPNSHYAIAWLDPAAKQSTPLLDLGTSRSKHRKSLYFPLSSETLHTPGSATIHIQILCPSRIPFHGGKLVGISVLPLSTVRLTFETFALPLRRPSGRIVGSVRVSSRVLWDLGFRHSPETLELECGVSGSGSQPSVPVASAPMSDEVNSVIDDSYDGDSSTEESSDDSYLPPVPELFSPKLSDGANSVDPPPVPEQTRKGGSAIGLLIGAVAVLVAGIAFRHWKVKKNISFWSLSNSGASHNIFVIPPGQIALH